MLAARGGALGDFLVTLPSLQALRRIHPGRRLELLARPACGEFAVAFGFADAWRSLDTAGAGTLASAAPDPAWLEWLSGFAEVVSWLPDPEGSFRRNSAPARFHQGVWRLEGAEPAALQLAALDTGALPLDATVARLSLPFPAGNRIALHPGSGSRTKTWDFENWRVVLRSCPRRELLLITGEAEDSHAARWAHALEEDGWPVRCARFLSLTDLARELRGCSLFLGHDTGPAHLAAACGVPCRLLFGPTDAAAWAPPAPEILTLRAPDGDLSRLTPAEVSRWLSEVGM